ncbi:TPA: hypothetical protein MI589_27625, partial [Klebsiella pneumoniae]|nr:hypothetical protein [Klebsiella pneumoniae]
SGGLIPPSGEYKRKEPVLVLTPKNLSASICGEQVSVYLLSVDSGITEINATGRYDWQHTEDISGNTELLPGSKATIALSLSFFIAV